MTTIAFDGVSIAYDSRATRDNLIANDSEDKMLQMNGYRIVSAGTESDFKKLLEVFFDDEDIEHDLNCSFIANHNDGRLIYVCTEGDRLIVESLWNEPFFAIGSGQSFALAAMDFGKTAKQAVEYARTRDCYTGGKVKSFKVKKPKGGAQ